MLVAKNLSFETANKRILENISVSIAPGEIFTILGPNGAGKSTLLKCLSGDFQHFSGKIEINQQSINQLTDEKLAELRAVMPQFIRLDFPFLVREVVQMALQPIPKAQLLPTAIKALERFEVAHLQARNYLTLSGGEQQRVQLARVFAQLEHQSSSTLSDRYLLLDECTSNLDLAHQHQVFQAARQFAKTHNVGIIAVLHDLNLAAQYSDRSLILKDGKIQALGEVKRVYQANLLSNVYGLPIKVMPHPKGWPYILPS
jgi:iron complex transport system ATP-binding protein